MVLFDLGSWAWNGMNLASSLYLAATVGGIVAAAFAITPMRGRRRAWFAFAGSMALVTVSLIWIYSLKQNKEAGASPIYIGTIPIYLLTLCTLTAMVSATTAAFCFRDAMRRPQA
jgi:hypothetical protein